MNVVNQYQHIVRIAVAVLFAATSSTAVVVTEAAHAGGPAQGLLGSAPLAASAGVRIGIRIGTGGRYRYNRYAYRGRTWVRFGFGYAFAPGYASGYYFGYAPPEFGYCPTVYYGPGFYPACYGPAYYRPAYFGRPYYLRPYYGRRFYGHAFYGSGFYGRRSYGRGFSGRADYGRSYYGRAFYGRADYRHSGNGQRR